MMNKEIIIQKLYNLCRELNRPPHKKEINSLNGFDCTYNQLVRSGITFKSLKFQEYLYEKNPSFCEKCEIKLPINKKNNKFCSKSCAAKINGELFPKRVSKYNGKQCLWCFNSIKIKSNYCNNKCRVAHYNMNRFLDWYYNNGDFSGSPKLIKSFIVLINGYKCFECGISNYNNKPLTLHLEHIDGNALNNAKNNLSLLCPNCHGQTPTYAGRNVGNGKRTWRNERYKQGKSY